MGKNRRILLSSMVAALLGVVALSMRPLGMPAQPPQAQPNERGAVPALLGTQSCATTVCHGGSGRLNQPASAYTTWVTLDPHARAYRVLLNETSQAIAKRLWAGKLAAHEAPRCLKCHVDPHYDRAEANLRRQDGVGCESCHGPADAWLHGHYRAGWNRKGMADTKTLPGRASVCVGCHVGMPGNDVDHDLIAVGHPVLRFEFATYWANLPPHWDVAKAKVGAPGDFEARAWATGQLVCAAQAVELLAHRVEPATGKTWPEFAELDCFACHHDLQASSWRQRPRARPGSLVRNEWYTAMLPDLIGPKDEKLVGLLTAVRTGTQPRQKLAADARLLAKSLHEASNRQATAASLEQLRFGPHVDSSWDAATQRYFALLALQQMDRDNRRPGDASVEALISALRKDLTFPLGYDSPRRWAPRRSR